MTHSDTYDLILASKDLGNPKPKTSYVEVPGSSQSLDFTEAFGDIQYSDRQISLTFLCAKTWAQQYAKEQTVRDALHGKKMNIIFDEDTTRYFVGRVSVDSWKYYKGGAGIVKMTIRADPWRYAATNKTLSATNVTNETLSFVNAGRKTVVPTISCTAAATIKWVSGGTTKTVELSAGNDQVIPQFTRRAGTTHVTVTTTGTITFTWQEADL